MRRPKRRSGRRGHNRLGFLITFMLLIGVIVFVLYRIDSIFMPMALDAAQRKIISEMDRVIDNAFSSVIREQHIESADLFVSNSDDNSGKVLSMYVDTVLVNEICNKMAVRISEDLNALGVQTVTVPVGSLSGYEVFSNTGPSYRIHLQPVGDALVNQRSERETVGINQVNILVWLDVKCEARIIVPFQKDKEIAVTRSLPLINTYFSQEVPNTYWNGGAAVITP